MIRVLIIGTLCFFGSTIAQKTDSEQKIPHENLPAYVRSSTDICTAEKQYIDARSARVLSSMEQLIGLTLAAAKVPKIAVCSSGGGVRAMIGTLGFLKGMELKARKSILDTTIIRPLFSAVMHYLVELFVGQPDVHGELPLHDNFPASLLDCCSYTAAVSGSSWAISGWLQSHMSVSNYLEHLAEIIHNETLFNDIDTKDVIYNLLNKYKAGQPITLVDLYGSLLAQKFLQNLGSKDQNSFNLVHYWYAFEKTPCAPFPIYSAILGNTMPDYQWIEFTPYEVGGACMQSYIPTWAFGRKFYQGASQDFVPAQSLGFGMGIWGSAMALNVHEFYTLIIKPKLTENLGTIVAAQVNAAIEKELNSNNFAAMRPFAARIHNWNYALNSAPLNTEKIIELVDAGIDYSIPLLPAIERQADILIVLDCSTDPIGKNLLLAVQDAQQKGYAMPTIDETALESICSVHGDPKNPNVPLIIYLPLIQNKEYCYGWDPRTASFTQLLNFTYTKEQVHQLAGLTAFNMAQSMPIITKTINDWIEKQNPELSHSGS